MEQVTEIDGVKFINDSEATNLNATYYALESMKQPTIWIVGGVDKGNDYTEIEDLVKKKVKAIVCLGIDNQKNYRLFQDKTELIYSTSSMEEAVKVSKSLAEKGNTVLLSHVVQVSICSIITAKTEEISSKRSFKIENEVGSYRKSSYTKT